MKKLLPVFVFLAFACNVLKAQLPDAIVAPNFTATDINGNTYTLYDQLNQGKSVVLFFGTTWSYNTFEYLQNGPLKNVWNQYGPNGTGEILVAFMEVDDGTDAADLDGSGDDTQGDFITGTPFPIFDNANFIGELYDLNDVPWVYHICPNRILYSANQFPTIQFELVHDDCLMPAGVNNAGMLRFINPPKEFCGEIQYQPSVRFQNLGTANMTSATLELKLNGNLLETRNWTGNNPTYLVAGTLFDPVTITSSSVLEVNIASVNGQPDEDASNNSLPATITEGASIGDNLITVEIKTDNYPTEIYWEVLDDQGTVFQTGGNPGIFVGEEWEGAYTDGNTVYSQEVALPYDGCYEFVIYDQYNDGICCNSGLGYYRILGDNNFIYLQGGLFTEPEHRPFSLEGAATINNNAAIRRYSGPQGDFCGEPNITPSLFVQNIGANTINSLNIDVLANNNFLQSFEWIGSLAVGQTDSIALEPIALEGTSEIGFVIKAANQQPDNLLYQNKIEVNFTRRQPETPSLMLEIRTDEWDYENYWQITNSAGDLVASGGNQVIGPNGGGLQVAQADDPGSYPQFSTITEVVSLPDNLTDCYTFLFVDDWGDGISSPGYIKISEGQGNVLFNFRPLTTGETYLLDGQFGPSAVSAPADAEVLSISPNPASDHINLSFSTAKFFGTMQLEVANTVGNILSKTTLPGGSFTHALALDGFSDGLYILKLTDGTGRHWVKKFAVARG